MYFFKVLCYCEEHTYITQQWIKLSRGRSVTRDKARSYFNAQNLMIFMSLFFSTPVKKHIYILQEAMASFTCPSRLNWNGKLYIFLFALKFSAKVLLVMCTLYCKSPYLSFLMFGTLKDTLTVRKKGKGKFLFSRGSNCTPYLGLCCCISVDHDVKHMEYLSL